MTSESISGEAGPVDPSELWQGLSFCLSGMGARWRVLNGGKMCSAPLFRRLNPAAMLGIDKHRSNESVSGATEII